MMLAATLTLILAQAAPIPFDEAGRAYLELAGKSRPKGANVPSRIDQRIAPLHQRLRLGALELWVPERVLNDTLRSKAGPSAKEVAPLAADFARLQEPWLERAGARGEELAAAREALGVIAAWAGELRKFEEPGKDVVEARERIEKIFFRRVLGENEHALVAVLAPTRAQFIGALGAAGLLAPQDRDTLCPDSARRNMTLQLAVGMTALAWTIGPDDARVSPLRDTQLERVDAHQSAVHSASHLISVTQMPTAPAWWSEGLAICDTVATLGADETLCTGVEDRSAGSGYTQMGGAAGILLWVTRHKSPYREVRPGSYYVDALRAAYASDGFQVLDIDNAQPAFRVPPPLLHERADMPDIVTRGLPGMKRGFAELYRAYCAAFVHWLGQQPGIDERSQLAHVCVELAKVPFQRNPTQVPLYLVAQRVTQKSIGMSTDPASDLEAAFVAWLASR